MPLKYIPELHQRRSIRLKQYDYTQAGAYFITICCHDKKCLFGNVGTPLEGAHDAGGNINAPMHLNEYGLIAQYEWIKLSERFPNFELDVYQIMPNHMHGIIVLNNTKTLPVAGDSGDLNMNAPHHGAAPSGNRAGASPAPTGNIIGAYKSLVANACLTLFISKNTCAEIASAQMGKIWQRNYYEHIIRNEKSHRIIADYIVNNPSTWNQDKFFEM